LTEAKVRNRPGVQFILTTVIGGTIFLVPLVFLVMILTQALSLMMVVAEPMAQFFQIDSIGGIALANLIALGAVVTFCFFAGLLARHSLAEGLVKKLETKVLMNIPGYSMVRGIKSNFDTAETEKMRPVALKLGTAERIALEMQKLPDGRSMIYIPSSPSPWSGITQILPADQITYLDIPVTKVIELTEKYGHGVEELLRTKMEPEAVVAESGDG